MSSTIHATTILIGEAGILLRGDSGSGKSSLARQVLQDAEARGLFARLVADDRTRIEQRHGRLVARALEATGGLIEVRGVGIVRRPAEPAVVVRVVVDLTAHEPERMPGEADRHTTLCGVVIRRIRARRDTHVSDVLFGAGGGLYDLVVTQ